MENFLVESIVNRSREMLQEGQSSNKILTYLAFAAEDIIGDGAVCSILVLDKDGLLRNGASPRLPFDYLAAIDGLKPSPLVGTCAAAAATGSIVITSNFLDDDKWVELRHLPMSLGFVGAWSVPIKRDDSKVLGTFGTYYREKKVPRQQDIDVVSALAGAAAHVLKVGHRDIEGKGSRGLN